jgi:hypothetical protein
MQDGTLKFFLELTLLAWIMPLTPASDRSPRVILFVKLPRPGTVKTRLGKAIGHNLAAQLYDCFVRDLCVTLWQLEVAPLIFFAPASQGAAMANWLGSDQSYYPQVGDDLGARMASAFQQGFQLGYDPLLILGSDNPDLPLDYLREAFEALAHDQVVIGPSHDGGYYALGFAQANYMPQVFTNMSWSTPTVFDQTFRILLQSPHSIHQLPDWYDVDTIEDLWQFDQRNQGCQPRSLSMQYLDRHRHDLFQRWIT